MSSRRTFGSFNPQWRARTIERSRAQRGFINVGFGRPQTMYVCPPPELILLTKKLGTYEVLWEPENLGLVRSGEVGIYLSVLLDRLRESNIKYVEVHVQTYGRRSIARLIRFMEKYLEKCREVPEAVVEVIVPKLVRVEIEWMSKKEA